MTTPYSSCSLERIFSQCKRNKLDVDILESILLFKQEYRSIRKKQKVVLEKPNRNQDNERSSNENSGVKSNNAMEIEENHEEKTFGSQMISTNAFAQKIADATVKGFEKAFLNIHTNPPLQIIDSSQKVPVKRSGGEIVREDLKKSKPNSQNVDKQSDGGFIEAEGEGNMADVIEEQEEVSQVIEDKKERAEPVEFEEEKSKIE